MAQVGLDEFLKRPVRTRPYMVAEEIKDYREAWEGDVYAALASNAAYWNKGHPKIEKVSFVRYSPKEAVFALIEGRVDLATSLIPKDTLKVEVSRHSKVVKGRQDVRYDRTSKHAVSPHSTSA